MKSAGFRIRLEPELRRAFVEACNEADISAAHVLRQFMRDYIDRSAGAKQQNLFDLSGSPYPDDQVTRN